MNLAIIIVNYNTLSYLKKLLVKIVPYSQKNLCDLIIIDNGEYLNKKRIPLKEEIKRRKFFFKIISNKNNLGFAQACNKGANLTDKKNLLFLNPDCFFPKISVIKKLLEILRSDSQIGIVAPKILKKKNEEQPQSFGDKKSWWEIIFGKSFLRKKTTLSLKNNCQIVEWVSGACFMVRKEVFEKISGFDPKFFLYFEDRDFCQRVIKAGFLILRSEKEVVYHKESKAKIPWKERKKLYYKSQNRYFRKHYGKISATIMKIIRIPIYVKNIYWKK